jgi:hypothetical protein
MGKRLGRADASALCIQFLWHLAIPHQTRCQASDMRHNKQSVNIKQHMSLVPNATWSEFLATDPEVPGSIQGAATFHE